MLFVEPRTPLKPCLQASSSSPAPKGISEKMCERRLRPAWLLLLYWGIVPSTACYIKNKMLARAIGICPKDLGSGFRVMRMLTMAHLTNWTPKCQGNCGSGILPTSLSPCRGLYTLSPVIFHGSPQMGALGSVVRENKKSQDELLQTSSRRSPRQQNEFEEGSSFKFGTKEAVRVKMSEADRIAKLLRAVLQSNKNGVALPLLQNEYKLLTGEWIPFSQLGYSTLEEYLKSIPSVVKLTVSSGKTICLAMTCKETENIAQLVARQKDSKKKTGQKDKYQMKIKQPTALVMPEAEPKKTLRKLEFSGEAEKYYGKSESKSHVLGHEVTEGGSVQNNVYMIQHNKSMVNK
ncbi:uncharacterized protein LOC119947923 [Tachyglossus aculeatus]|uniref:uncharacterized protein LOC119947923 n=1 Tax=Tachyglossus aculeatus TaxID=9261 RepID=UPI0018F3BBFB|nr:uncharacterized protein LOC119947923 [Tachyglossus aculeatus]